jgi:hypothetical protein
MPSTPFLVSRGVIHNLMTETKMREFDSHRVHSVSGVKD